MSPLKLRPFTLPRLTMPRQHLWLSLLASLYMVIAFNSHIIKLVANSNPPNNAINLLYLVSIFITLTAFLWLVIELPAHGKGRPWWVMILLVIAAAGSHAREAWHIVFDETMFRNIIETDIGESSELLSWQWLMDVMLFGVLPATLLAFTTHLPGHPVKKLLLHKSLFLTGVVTLLLLSIFPFYDRYASLLRTHRHLKETIIPTAILNSGYNYFRDSLPQQVHPLVVIGKDAKLSYQSADGKKIALVIVVGETARAANFSLSGYARATNPMLEKRLQNDAGLVYFPNFFSCGTSTAISVPCMFSALGRNNFDVDKAKHTENLLDVFRHAGFDVIWIDNNSGCKGVCDRVTYTELRNRSGEGCDKYGCRDMMLVSEMNKHLQSLHNNTVIILHQKGSHGPSYTERVPHDKQQFQPVCHSSQLQECTETEIINSYDNTILYTDTVLDQVISTLEKNSEQLDSLMLYASDHGESLGENNLYLHGLPWAIAPDEQKHVPALLWLSPGFRQTNNINTDCLRSQSQQEYSHDNIFHTLLGLGGVATATYHQPQDITSPCRDSHSRIAEESTQAPAGVN